MTWDPTPIPDQPLQFNVNLWHSRSKEFAWPLASAHLSASASILSVEIRSTVQEAVESMDVVCDGLVDQRVVRT